MKVSVIIPAWNASRYLHAALESVLVQSVPPLEVIVIDDGSDDGTASIARAFPIRLISQEHQGAAVARNAGITAAHGDCLAFLDADDLWLPQKLELQLEVLRDDAEIDVVFTGVEEFISEDTPEVRGQVQLKNGMQTGALTSALLARRNVFERVGPFPVLQAGDWIAWLAAAKRLGIKMRTVEQLLVRRRIHISNMGRTNRTQIHKDYLKLLRQHLQAKRQENR